MSTITDIRELHDAPLPEESVKVISLVQQVVDAFAAAGDLYRVLKEKAEGGWKEVERVKKSHNREERVLERIEYRTLDANGRGKRDSGYMDADEASIGEGAALIGKEFDRGIKDIGQPFAHGDSLGQIKILNEVVALQNTTIAIYATCFAHLGHDRPIPQHISRLLSRVRVARKHVLEALNDQYQRMFIPPPVSPSEIRASLSSSSSASSLTRMPQETMVTRTKSVRSHRERPESRLSQKPRSRSLAGHLPPTTLDRNESDLITTKDGPTSVITNVNRHKLFCLYALDLQDHKTQPLSDAYHGDGSGACPYCTTVIRTNPGRTWEIYKEDSHSAKDRVYHIENRFVVKSHREDGGFACALCVRTRDADTVMEDIVSLVDHVWREHTVEEYEKEIDIREVAL